MVGGGGRGIEGCHGNTCNIACLGRYFAEGGGGDT